MMHYIVLLALLLNITINASAAEPNDNAAAAAGFHSFDDPSLSTPLAPLKHSPFNDGEPQAAAIKAQNEKTPATALPPSHPGLSRYVKELAKRITTLETAIRSHQEPNERIKKIEAMLAQHAQIIVQQKQSKKEPKSIRRLEGKINALDGRIDKLMILLDAQRRSVEKIFALQKDQNEKLQALMARQAALEQQKAHEESLLASPLLSPVTPERRLSDSKKPDAGNHKRVHRPLVLGSLLIANAAVPTTFLKQRPKHTRRSATPPVHTHKQLAAAAHGHVKGNKSVGCHNSPPCAQNHG